jgi:thiamine biosynthesis lipoprotein
VTATLDRLVHVEHVMGTAVSFDVRGDCPPGAIERAVAWLHAVDAEFSTYRPDSGVSRYARGKAPSSADLRWVIDRCELLRAETGGFFDAHATGSFDPSALVKGWAVQRAADGLRMEGVEQLCVNAGGDVVAFGRSWLVGIRHPRDPHALAAIVEAQDLAVATSALYERGAHIVTPQGRAPEGVLSVTVVGADLGMADAYATAAFAMGAGAAEWTLGLADYEALTILADESVWTTPGLPAVTA